LGFGTALAEDLVFLAAGLGFTCFSSRHSCYTTGMV
jgi:hypothetical protein